MSIEEIKELTIAELEDLFDGFAECNKSNNGTSTSKKTLEDKDALRYLINNGGKI